MIASMTKYSFVLLNGQQEDLLENLQEIGLVDITRSAKPIDETSQKLAGEVELLDGLIHGLNNAVIPEGVTPEYIDGDIVRLAGGQIMRYSEDSVQIKMLEKEVHHLKAWGQFDKEQMDQLEEAGVHLHFHVISKKHFKQAWKEEYALTFISEGKNTVRFWTSRNSTLKRPCEESPAPRSVSRNWRRFARRPWKNWTSTWPALLPNRPRKTPS